ncbi:MAG: hypothetical protein BBJ57_05165 [Desulfobacterales bacterium PC51MH44]|nr:MAG: hypothetical protein BBJ57_05165 [Desulfobacterales bacterium PC51MH44]
MISIDSDSPRWLRELARFLPLKNLLFIHGNILDLISYPVKRSESDEVYWTESDLPRFFERFLTSLEYEVVGFFDPVDGLTFPSASMEKLFKQIQSGKVENRQAEQQEVQSKGREKRKILPRLGGRNVDPNQALDKVRVALRNNMVPCAFVFNLASRLVTSPTHLTRDESSLFTKALKASMESSDVFKEESQWNNVLIFICDKLNDLPPFLYLNNPKSRSIFIEKPDTIDRSRFIKRTYHAFHREKTEIKKPSTEFVSLFAALTEGLANYEMKSLVRLSRKEKIPIERIQNICERYKYGITESEWDKIDKARLDKSEEFIKARIKGQDMAISRVLDIIKRARMGLAAGSSHKTSRPRGILFFAGPTGVGKTEMAKSLAELLFGQEERCIRFDMSEYSAPQADQKLLGAPPGYVGYDEGGQLTNAIKEKPFSILLFDEIEKAHGSIFDKFLQILGDGRLTDGKGETVYFSESIIIFTSNLGTVTQSDGPEENGGMVSPEMPYHQMRDVILKSITDHFNFELRRPEILNRFGDNFVVFDFIRPPVDEEIIELLISKLIEAARENRNINLGVERPFREKLTILARNNLQHGGRGIRNVIDSALVNPLNRLLFDHGDIDPGLTVKVADLIDNGHDAPYRFELEVKVDKP